MSGSRYRVGIDLGTTNSAIAYVDTQGRSRRPRLLPVPQVVAPREVERRETLPSFLYRPDEREREADVPGGADKDWVVGTYARDRGALVPTRLVASAKSWLCHPSADRSSKLLPWGAEEGLLSPVEASTRILGGLRDAWNQAVAKASGGLPIEQTPVVLAVPASFDQEARELTLQAAGAAGLREVRLIEEPLAAFYAWLSRQARSLSRFFRGNELVLVCDVGGGTTDLTLVRTRLDDDVLGFERIAVGEHLLLGGDNLDLALARRLETRLGRSLSLTQRLALRRSVSAAKERLLSDGAPDSASVTVLGGGGALVGGTTSIELRRGEVVEALEEFLPTVASSDRPSRERKTGLQELGLPYATDPAITRHLVAFLAEAGGGTPLRPDMVLFNGGFFTPPLARELVVQAIGGLFSEAGRWRPEVLENENPAAAVALGSAHYALVAQGEGVRVRAGSPRTYYLGLSDGIEPAGPEHLHSPTTTAVCLLSKGTEEGTTVERADREFLVATNRPVAFPLLSSATRSDPPGSLVTLQDDEVQRHAPLASVLRYGRKSRHVEIPVHLSVSYTETGTLQVSLASKASEHQWRLQFQLRGEQAGEAAGPPSASLDGDESAAVQEQEDASIDVPEEAMTAAVAALHAVFSSSSAASPPIAPHALPAHLESVLGFARASWPTAVIRRLADALLPLVDGRKRGPTYEARWLNLLGFCMRPGFGAPLDDWRIGRVRGLYVEGLAHPADIQCQVEWVILWQRVAGGLKAGQQRELAQRYATLLGVRGAKGAGRVNPQIQREAWRLLASLEHLPAQDRVRYGEALLDRLRREPGNAAYLWSLGRLGARIPAYGPLSAVVPPDRGAAWIRQLLSLRTFESEAAAAVSQIGAQSDDPSRDIDPDTRQLAMARLEDLGLTGEAERLRQWQPLARRDALRLFGETLPAGLRLGEGVGSPPAG